MTIGYRNGVGIGEIVVYVPTLFIAVYLAIKHGFGRSAGWYFLIIFSLARIIGPAMLLATLNTTNTATLTRLYTGYLILQNIGLSPLMLASLGLLSRISESIIRNGHRPPFNSFVLKIVELLTLVGLILGIVGGINATSALETTGKYSPGAESKAGVALFIVSYVMIVIGTIVTSFSMPHAEPGEKRILIALAVSLPFLAIRLVYSIMSIIANDHKFNSFEGSVSVLLCMALLEELVIVVTYEIVGLTLKVIPKKQDVEHLPSTTYSDGRPIPGVDNNKGSNVGSKILKIAQKTIIGRIIMALIPKKDNRGVEMQDQQFVRK